MKQEHLKEQQLHPILGQGLSELEARKRQEQGLNHIPFVAKSKSVRAIFRDNIISLFNILNFILAGLVLLVAWNEPKLLTNLFFMGVIFSNIFIGIVQELRAKFTVDRLRDLTDPQVTVIREGRMRTVPTEQVVLGDWILLRAGNQVPVDGICRASQGLELDESQLTGEADPVRKQIGEEVLSGSFVVAGQAQVEVVRVGDQTYAAGIAREVKRSKKARSQILQSINQIIKVLSWVIIPVGLLLFASKFFLAQQGTSFSYTVVSTVAALVGMIPEGLMLMTSLAFAVGIVHLGKKKTLVQMMPSIETLARVDTLCLDKTGTITTGEMDFLYLLPLRPVEEGSWSWRRAKRYKAAELSASGWTDFIRENPQSWLAELAVAILSQTEENATQQALNAVLHPVVDDLEKTAKVSDCLPFNSRRKYWAVNLGDFCYALGAPEFLLDPEKSSEAALLEQLQQITGKGYRVLLALRARGSFQAKKGLQEGLPREHEPLAWIVLGDQLRPDAAATFSYFQEQGVQLKVISGDNPQTVSAVAARAGLPCAEKTLDVSTQPDEADWLELAEHYTIFGRVTPHRKQKLLHALQQQGHVVAMTGDGVNDVPALKDADCGVAMASGSDAARSASDLVLLGNHLRGLIDAVYEGRRVINNIERVAILFLVKTIYSCLMAILFIVLPYPFPIFPIQITLISSLTIGLPGFVLALKPNRERVSGQFLRKVVYRCVPAGISCTLMVILSCVILSLLGRSPQEISAFSTLALIVGGMLVLWEVCLPWDGWKRSLYVGLLLLFAAALLVVPSLFLLQPLLQWEMLFFIPLFLIYWPMLKIFHGLKNTGISRWLSRALDHCVRHLDGE